MINKCEEKEKKREEEKKRMNPMTPKEDIYQKFYWTSSMSHPTSLHGNGTFPNNTIWNVTQPFPTGNLAEKYYRSKKSE
jgi:hypothetical protein